MFVVLKFNRNKYMLLEAAESNGTTFIHSEQASSQEEVVAKRNHSSVGATPFASKNVCASMTDLDKLIDKFTYDSPIPNSRKFVKEICQACKADIHFTHLTADLRLL